MGRSYCSNCGRVGCEDDCDPVNLKEYPKPYLNYGESWLDSHLVSFPVSYRYNGGVIIEGEHYDGVDVPDPIIPHGYTLKGIGVGLNLNIVPPYATYYLKPLPKVEEEEEEEED
jgi:hypothetical protein